MSHCAHPPKVKIIFVIILYSNHICAEKRLWERFDEIGRLF